MKDYVGSRTTREDRGPAGGPLTGRTEALHARSLTGEGLDRFHGPLVVGTVHEGVAVLHEELSGVGDLVLVEGPPQVLGGHAVA